MEIAGIAAFILNVGAKCRCMVSFHVLGNLFPGKVCPVSFELEGGWAPESLENRRIFFLARN